MICFLVGFVCGDSWRYIPSQLNEPKSNWTEWSHMEDWGWRTKLDFKGCFSFKIVPLLWILGILTLFALFGFSLIKREMTTGPFIRLYRNRNFVQLAQTEFFFKTCLRSAEPNWCDDQNWLICYQFSGEVPTVLGVTELNTDHLQAG